jgi:hypothetical protein
VKVVQRLKHSLKLILRPHVVVVVPCIYFAWENPEFETCHNPKVVSRTLHGPKQIRIACIVDPDHRAIGQNNIQVNEIIAD